MAAIILFQQKQMEAGESIFFFQMMPFLINALTKTGLEYLITQIMLLIVQVKLLYD